MDVVVLPFKLHETEMLGFDCLMHSMKWCVCRDMFLMYQIFEWLDEEKTTWQLKSET